ncbi:hypothetical protein MRX96_022155 [Rhipicephalus microplus]
MLHLSHTTKCAAYIFECARAGGQPRCPVVVRSRTRPFLSVPLLRNDLSAPSEAGTVRCSRKSVWPPVEKLSPFSRDRQATDPPSLAPPPEGATSTACTTINSITITSNGERRGREYDSAAGTLHHRSRTSPPPP